ncbi:hypothetical protein FORC066_3104 [Yersinia enterocolitica]|nr:hypothetical protein FORC066_3104 [Yersinia enterocolitica]
MTIVCLEESIRYDAAIRIMLIFLIQTIPITGSVILSANI